MGACILYLAGPGGVFLNGQVIYPDGGRLLLAVDSNCRLIDLGNILVQPAAT
jgi:hypothetical protein